MATHPSVVIIPSQYPVYGICAVQDQGPQCVVIGLPMEQSSIVVHTTNAQS